MCAEALSLRHRAILLHRLHNESQFLALHFYDRSNRRATLPAYWFSVA
jgi:hypothetical protein